MIATAVAAETAVAVATVTIASTAAAISYYDVC